MGWSYRKSFGTGPFRINVSRSGVGYSIGGRGFRTGVDSRGRRYTSVSIPGTGLRHVSYGGKGQSPGCAVVLLIAVVSLLGAIAFATVHMPGGGWPHFSRPVAMNADRVHSL